MGDGKEAAAAIGKYLSSGEMVKVVDNDTEEWFPDENVAVGGE